MQSNTLSYGSVLHGNQYNYIIEKVLGQGSFGITYLASVKMQGTLGSIDAKVKVAVKEFFMKEINGREGTTVTSGSKGGLFADYRKKFIREATNLSKLQHPNIIKVLECFEANNTVYYTMEYLDGGSLDELITKKQGLPEAEAIKYIRQIAEALSYMHEHKVLHLDLKPGNIMLNNGNAVLIDFGLSKQYDASGNPESSTTVGAGTPGYAPIEQSSYRDGNGFPVTMDIYALGATMYKMLTGQRPPDASEVLNEGLPDKPSSVSSETWTAVGVAMEPKRNNRPQSVEKWLDILVDDEGTNIDIVVPQQTTAKEEVFSVTANGISFNMIRVEGGTFTMGATSEQGLPDSDEKPTHQVTLSSYYIGETVVTQALWKAVMGSNPSRFKGDNLPVECVSWNDCQDFIKELNWETGRKFRLPTEAEWEFAARGGNKSNHTLYSGSANIDEVAWYDDNSADKTHSGSLPLLRRLRWYGGNSTRKPHPVKTKKANELGLYDMTGNVWEWCQDWRGTYCSNAQTNPTGSGGGFFRVFRGGSWDSYARHCRSSSRGGRTPGVRDDNVGLRLVLSE